MGHLCFDYTTCLSFPIGKNYPVRDKSPTANVQVLWLDALQSHEAVNACGGRVRCAGGGEGYDGGEFHKRMKAE